MKACQCSEHVCSGWGGMLTVHTMEGPVALCRHCFTMGHNWQSEAAFMAQLEELREGFPEQDHQLEADRWHGRA